MKENWGCVERLWQENKRRGGDHRAMRKGSDVDGDARNGADKKTLEYLRDTKESV